MITGDPGIESIYEWTEVRSFFQRRVPGRMCLFGGASRARGELANCQTSREEWRSRCRRRQPPKPPNVPPSPAQEGQGVPFRGKSGVGDGVHILTGPIYVCDAEPGDVLQVWGMSAGGAW